MGSKTSKTKRPNPVETEVVIIPKIPQDIIDEILDHLAADSDYESLRVCALVSKSWIQPCRRHIFRAVVFTSRAVDRWFELFPVPDESPAHHVRDLRVWINGNRCCVPEKFFEYTPQFTGAERMELVGHMGPMLLLRPSYWKLPQSITSLTINTNAVTLVQVRDIMAQLSNLDDLSLYGSLVAADRREFPGIGTVLTGRFGGQLTLEDEYVGEDVVNMLLDIPSGLRFTEVRIHCMTGHLPSAVPLAEACCTTLVKLSYSVASKCESHPFS